MDYRARVMGKFYQVYGIIVSVGCTIWCRIKMKLWGVEYGRKCEFRGDAIFFRAIGTKIRMGEECVFNSTSRFNFRGVNHCCIMQTNKGGNIYIGDRFGASGLSIVSSVSVNIGNDVMCGANVIIGDRNDHEDRYPEWTPAPIIIGNNVWIGMNSVVMRGVTIGDNVIIGANSVVTRDIPKNTIAVGCPCKVIKVRQLI